MGWDWRVDSIVPAQPGCLGSEAAWALPSWISGSVSRESTNPAPLYLPRCGAERLCLRIGGVVDLQLYPGSGRCSARQESRRRWRAAAVDSYHHFLKLLYLSILRQDLEQTARRFCLCNQRQQWLRYILTNRPLTGLLRKQTSSKVVNAQEGGGRWSAKGDVTSPQRAWIWMRSFLLLWNNWTIDCSRKTGDHGAGTLRLAGAISFHLLYEARVRSISIGHAMATFMPDGSVPGHYVRASWRARYQNELISGDPEDLPRISRVEDALVHW